MVYSMYFIILHSTNMSATNTLFSTVRSCRDSLPRLPCFGFGLPCFGFGFDVWIRNLQKRNLTVPKVFEKLPALFLPTSPSSDPEGVPFLRIYSRSPDQQQARQDNVSCRRRAHVPGFSRVYWSGGESWLKALQRCFYCARTAAAALSRVFKTFIQQFFM